MNIRNIALISLISLSPVTLQGMNTSSKTNHNLTLYAAPNGLSGVKRPAERSLNNPSIEKRHCNGGWLTPNTRPNNTERSLPKQEIQVNPIILQQQNSQDDPIVIYSPEETSQADLLAAKIKQTIYNFDSILLGKLLITDEISELSKEQKEELHKQAKQQKETIIQIRTLGNGIISQSDNEEIREKFSYNSEYDNIQKITHNLYALKTLPKLTFPQAFFTNAQRYRIPNAKPTPDKALLALIKNEQEKISVCCYNFDLECIAKKLVHKKNKGIIVEVIIDQDQKNLGVLKLLINGGISVLAPQNDPYEHNHHKFSLFQCNLFNKKLLCHGSFNYTSSAIERNWEDMSISEDSDLIDQHEQQFKQLKECSNPKLLENIKR